MKVKKSLMMKIEKRNSYVLPERRITFEEVREKYLQRHPDDITSETYEAFLKVSRYFRLKEEENILAIEIERVKDHCRKDCEMIETAQISEEFTDTEKNILKEYSQLFVRRLRSLETSLM
jgi:hypothetical protein